MYFLDKRSKNEELLICKSFLLSRNITEKYIKIFNNSIFHSFLSKNLSNKLVTSYFRKKFFYENINVFNQIIINEHDKKFNRRIAYNSFEQKKILKTLDKNLFGKCKINVINQSKSIKSALVSLKSSYYKFLKFINHKKSKIDFKRQKIAISLVEGLDPSFKSDVYWDPQVKNKKDILIYIESPYLLRKFKKHIPYIEKLKKSGTAIINLWEEEVDKNNFEDLLYKLKNIKTKSFLDQHLKNISMELVMRVSFWVNFFKKYNIKVHIDSDDLKYENIAKQIALDLTDGCSIGKVKSYITPNCPLFFEYYHNDIFFCWGKRIVENIKKMKKNSMITNIKNLVISGNLNQINNKDIIEKISKIKKNFKSIGVKKNILILDTSHDDNKNYNEQLMLSKKVNYFYSKIIDFASNDKKVGLIIKPKKSLDYLDKDIKKKISNLAKNKKIYVENNFKVPVKNFAKISDFAISLTVDSLPSAMLEALCENKKLRCVFYDYPKCSKKEKIFSWGNKKVFFNNLDNMLETVKKNLFIPQSKIGIWPKTFLNSLSPFKPVSYNDKAKYYIQNLIKQFQRFKKKNESISAANHLFKRKYGNNLIVKI